VFDNAEKDRRPLGSWGFFDKTGKLAIPATLEWAGEFSEGLAPFATGCNQSGVKQSLEADEGRFSGRSSRGGTGKAEGPGL
jgi:hypothetical protein